MSGNLPSVDFNKVNANAGTVPPSEIGVLAIIASCANAAGVGVVPALTPTTFTRPGILQAAFGEGKMVDWGAYELNTAKLPILGLKPNTSTAGSYSAVATGGITGTAVPTAGSAASLADDYDDITVVITNGGVIGTPGIFYKIALDGDLFSAPIALGSALSISPTVPVTGSDSGIRITMGTGASTYLAGDKFSLSAVGPRMTTADLTAALEPLRVTKQPWDLLLVQADNMPASAATILDSWLSSLEAVGKFRTALINTRHKNAPAPATESEGAFLTAMTALGMQGKSIRVLCGSDGGWLISPVSGLTKVQPVALGVAARAESQGLGVDPAERDLGPIPGFVIDDQFGNPQWHDEMLYPGLDALGLTAFRSWDDVAGTYVNNANLLSSPGSDYVYLQHARTMNRGCEIGYARCANLISKGVPTIPGGTTILPPVAKRWSASITKAIVKELAGQVTGVSFTIALDDDLSGNGPATLTCTLAIASLKYVKTFKVTAEFVNSI
jgi:hypothetical protein